MPGVNMLCTITLSRQLRVLTPEQICQIDECLSDVEDFGEVRLIKRKGRLRFIEKTESIEIKEGESYASSRQVVAFSVKAGIIEAAVSAEVQDSRGPRFRPQA